MKFLILLIIVCIVVYIIYVYFSNEQAKLKHKLVVIAQHNEALKKELCINKATKICAKYSQPLNNSGILDENINLYIAPLTNSSVINKSKAKIQVDILDECNLCDVTWFYISIPTDSDINSHGWVKKSDFTTLCSNSQDVEPINLENTDK